MKYSRYDAVIVGSGISGLFLANKLAESNSLKEGILLVTKEKLLQLIYSLSELSNNIKWSSQKTIMFQTGIIKVCRHEETSSTSNSGGSSLLKRIEQLENKLAALQVNPGMQVVTPVASVQTFQTERREAPVEKKTTTSASSGGASDVWKRVIENLKRSGKIRLYTSLINSRINVVNDLIWEIEFPNGLTSFNQRILEDVNNKNELMQEIFKATGKEIHIKYKDGKAPAKETNNVPKSPISDLGIDINIIE